VARYLIAGDEERHRLAVGEAVLAVGKNEVFSPRCQRPPHLRRQRQRRGAPGPAAVGDFGGRVYPALLGVGAHKRLGVADPGPDLHGGAGEEHLEEQHRRDTAGGALRQGRFQAPAAGIAGGRIRVGGGGDAQLMLAHLGIGGADPALQIAVHLHRH